MKIRTKLTLTFFGIVIIVLTVVSVSIYFFSADYRRDDFYRRLKNRALNTANVLTGVQEVNAELLRRMERNNPASLPNQYILIFNNSDDELYSSDGTKVIPVNSSLLKQIAQRKEIHYQHGDYEVLGFMADVKGARFTVVAAATDDYGLDALKNLRNVLIVTFCASLILVSIIGWFYAGKVLSPISKIVDDVSNITEINLNERLDEGNKTDELSKLSGTFNRMLERLQSAFSAQKNFIANASHEIKTPITVMSAEIDVTLLQERDKDHYVRVLRSVLDGLKALNKLSTQLLLLAQTSADEPQSNFSLLRIDDILWEIKDGLLKAHPEYVIDILLDLNLNHESLLIEGDEHLVKIAILNLVDNGCKYSDDNHVVINLKSNHPGAIAIEFLNNGPGIYPTNLEKIFQPFFRGENHKKTKGFGIGLSLVSRIVTLHNGSISVESVPEKETKFTVVFPIRRLIKSI